ncbi:hypothetical protein OKW37_001072 [Paraburkholderia sp. MM5482-R2]
MEKRPKFKRKAMHSSRILNTRKTVQASNFSVIALSVAQKGKRGGRPEVVNTTQHIIDSATKIADITAIIEALRFRPTFSR